SRLLKRDIRLFGLTASAFLVLSCLVYFRTVRMLLYVALMLAGYLFLLQVMLSWVGTKISFVSIAFFPLLVGLQIMLLAHLCRTFRLHLDAGADVASALTQTVTQIWTSCLFAALTTMAGLLSLAFAGYSQSTNMGLMGSAGVLIGLLFTFGPGVSLLRVCHVGLGRRQTPASRERLSSRVWRLPKHLVVLCGLVLIVLSGFGLIRLKTDIQVLHMFPEKSFTRHMAEDFENIYGGKTFLRLSFDSGQKDGIMNPALLTAMMRIQNYAEKHESVSATYSYASILVMINEVWEGWAPGSNVLPNAFKIALFDTLLRNQKFPFTDALYSTDRRVGYVYVRSLSMTSQAYLQVVADIQAYARDQLPAGVLLVVDEGLHSLLSADRRMMQAQARTVSVTLVVMALVLLVLWRSVRLMAVALFVVILPVLVTLGVAGYLGVPLNSVTFMFCAIALGIAVDDVVHFITYWVSTRARLGDSAALIETLRVKGAPIVFTSLLLIGVFVLFALTSFPPAIHFGLLSALTFALSLLAVLFALPPLLINSNRSSNDKTSPP
ncbi:MAG: MMPL family transporter, partial [Verrucomicrobia bacterium]|nr:MMPL family transporter [Verrucomicrobiota bacterium]